MIVRTLTLIAGLSGAAVTAQFPEFSQQYAQRLGGAVDELTAVVADFDASAQASGLTRQEALAQMQGSDFLTRRRADMETTLQRHERLSAAMAALQDAGPFTRAYELRHFSDAEIARRTYDAYKPALPLTFEGAAFAIVGYAGAALVMALLLALLKWPFSRGSQARSGRRAAR